MSDPFENTDGKSDSEDGGTRAGTDSGGVGGVSKDVVPFGKYRGEPVERLIADTDYCEWLSAQAWFRERYGRIYQLVVNYGTEPQDSPEHNEMQARFLDENWCRALTVVLNPDCRGSFDVEAAVLKAQSNEKVGRALAEGRAEVTVTTNVIVGDSLFEYHGWDVVLCGYLSHEINYEKSRRVNRSVYEDRVAGRWMKPARIEITETITTTRRPPDLERAIGVYRFDDGGRTSASGWRGPNGEWVGRYQVEDLKKQYSNDPLNFDLWMQTKPVRDYCECKCDSHGYVHAGRVGVGLEEDCWEVSHEYEAGSEFGGAFIECKPDLGDDYPSVLRQVKQYPFSRGVPRVVVVRRASFQAVSWEQVKSIFAKDGIKIVTEAEIVAVTAQLDLEGGGRKDDDDDLALEQDQNVIDLDDDDW
jgi:hypothetical protein